MTPKANALCQLCQLGHGLDGVHVTGQLSQQSRLVSRPRAYLEDLLFPFEPCQAQVQCVSGRSGNCLAVTERQRHVFIGSMKNGVWHEHVTRHHVEGVQDREILHAFASQGLDQTSPIPAVCLVYPPCIHVRTSLISR